jgi:hypothetical protein
VVLAIYPQFSDPIQLESAVEAILSRNLSRRPGLPQYLADMTLENMGGRGHWFALVFPAVS